MLLSKNPRLNEFLTSNDSANYEKTFPEKFLLTNPANKIKSVTV